MAVDKKKISIKKKKPKRMDAEEEIVITIGKKPKEEKIAKEPLKGKEKEGGEEEIEIEKELEEELEDDLEEEPERELGVEEEEEVVVISLGKPSEVEEEVEPAFEEEAVEVVAEEEVEEEEEEEEKEGRVEKKRPVDEEVARKRKKWLAIIIALIVIVASIGFYLLFFQNQDPIARINVSPETASTGELILVDGSKSSDDKGIVEYTFYFGDNDVYSEKKDTTPNDEFDGKATHFYREDGEYTIELIVKDKERRTNSAKIRITITELEVTIPYEKIGDSCIYDVSGSVDVENDDGLWSGSTEQGTFTLKKIHLDYSGEMIFEISTTISQQDGYGDLHETLQRDTTEDLDLSGTISGTVELSGGAQINPTFDIQNGELNIKDNSYVDLNTNKTIFSYTESHLIVSAGPDLEMKSDDYLRSYSNLREKPAVFRVEDLSSDRSFKVGDYQLKDLGDISYYWEVNNATYIKGYPCLEVEIRIHQTVTGTDIEEFDMRLWIANQIPYPIKTYIYTKIHQNETTIIAYYNNEIEVDGFERGDLFIQYGTCPAGPPDNHFPQRDLDYEFVNWDPGDYIPKMGSNSSSFDAFLPLDAISYAKNQPSSGLDEYLASHPEAYVVDGFYNETGDNPIWNLTFGQLGDDIGYYVVVDYDGVSYHIKEEDAAELPELRNSTSDFDPILSFSASEQVFQSDANAIKAFQSGKVRFFEGYSYGARANMIYPSISITISLTVERAEYGYYLKRESEDSAFYAAVDGINGQLMYVWDHDGDNVLAAIGM